MAMPVCCLPFNTLPDEDLLNHLCHDTISLPSYEFRKLFFDPLLIFDEKYNNDIDVNYNFSHNLTIPDTIYTFFDSLKLTNNNDTLTILSLNIRSIPTNLTLFSDLFLSMSNFVTDLDILCFTETRLDDQIIPLYQLPGYTMFNTCRNRYGGGVAVYICRKYKSKLSDICSIINIAVECLGVEFSCLDKRYFCLCVYRPPNGSKNLFLCTLSDILTEIFDKNYTAVYVLGDFNVDLLVHKNDNFVNDFINLMYSFSFLPLITRPTRVTDTSASLIDHIWTSQVETNTSNFILETDISDHFPVLSQFKFNNPIVHPVIYKEIRIYSDSSIVDFTSELQHINWSPVLLSSDANESYNTFYKKFKDLYDKYFPIKRIRFNTKNDISPHVTPALRNSIKERNRLERLARKWPLTYREMYRKYKTN